MSRFALVVLLVSSVAAAAPCPLIPNKPVVLTPANAQVAADGGFVVVQRPDYDHGDKPTPPLISWKFADGSKPKIVHVAPGLDVLPVAGAKATLDKISVTTGKPAALAAPKVVSVTYTSTPQMRHGSTSVTAVLADLPATVIAVVAFDKAGVARSWGVPTSGAVILYRTGGCDQAPEGTTPISPGDEIRLAYVDAAGRLGPQSAVVTVK
jgi:hypothetical protein